MTFETHGTTLAQPEDSHARLTPKEKKMLDFERYAYLENELRTLKELASAGQQKAIEKLAREGAAMQAELDRITLSYSDEIATQTQDSNIA